MITKKQCPNCGKTSEIKSEFRSKTFNLITFKCNHSIVEQIIPEIELSDIEAFKSIDGNSNFKYQNAGVKFVFESNGRCLIGDEMGLGKSRQSLVPLALRKNDFLPTIIVCKAVATGNWQREVINNVKTMCQVISKTTDVWHEMFPVHIISYDMLVRIMTKASKKESSNLDFKKIHDRVKTIIIDETHLIKNEDTSRAFYVKKLCEDKKHIIGLSGTPIKNNATELFTILNILHPEKYFRFESFCRNNVETIFDGKNWKYGGLKYPEDFKRETSKFIIRRTMDEVLPDVPKLWRHPAFIELEDEVADIYNKEEAKFAEYFESHSQDRDFMSNILAMMARLRHITSLAKIDFCIDNIVSFLGSNERKLAIFTHHLDSRDILAEKLNATLKSLELKECLVLANNDPSQIEKSLEDFKNGKQRVIILSTLSHGESLNMQFCSDSILHERQWNPANEDQAISGRFRRIGQTAERINCTILVAVGTIDEYFAELVEKKRQYFDETVNGKRRDVSWDETSLMMDLANIIAEKGRKKWKIA